MGNVPGLVAEPVEVGDVLDETVVGVHLRREVVQGGVEGGHLVWHDDVDGVDESQLGVGEDDGGFEDEATLRLESGGFEVDPDEPIVFG